MKSASSLRRAANVPAYAVHKDDVRKDEPSKIAWDLPAIASLVID
jgi:hypothetical protein